MRTYRFFVYILASRSKTLYVGVTNNLWNRVLQHREGTGSVFTSRYRVTRLVYFEVFQYVSNAIAREKELKDWNRARKLALIEGTNPAWTDFAEGWSREAVTPVYEGKVEAEGNADPSASLRDDKG